VQNPTVFQNQAEAAEGGTVPLLRVRLLGGFWVEVAGVGLPDSAWRRRSARGLTKLLATHPSHALHREQILDILWPNVDLESARNGFAKALHAARRAFEPELSPRERSAYFHLRDEMLTLDTEHVFIDADHFQRLAESALRLGTVSAYETALAAYSGELLPEDRYEDWAAARRQVLSELSILVLLGLADTLERHGTQGQAVERLHAVLLQDPTREDVHRRLMRLYAEMGARGHAVRQFETLREVLRRELDMTPGRETEALYQDVLADQIQRRATPPEPGSKVSGSDLHLAVQSGETPFVGRDLELRLLHEQFTRSEQGRGAVVLVSGEAGVGKTRLVAEFLAEARGRRLSVLESGRGGHVTRVHCGPFAAALEGYVASRPEAERAEMACRYPALAHLIPSLEPWTALPPVADRPGDASFYLLSAVVRLLTDLEPVLLVLDDVNDADVSCTELLQYLTSFAPQHQWLVVALFRDEEVSPPSEHSSKLETIRRERVSVRVELERLGRRDCDHLVRALLPGGVVPEILLDRMYGLTLGNPLFVEELVREMRERNYLALAEGRWHASSSAHVPMPVHALVERAIGRADGSVRPVLALAAVAGTKVTLADLRTGAAALRPPFSEAQLFDGLDWALHTRILVEREDAYVFRHPLVRAALYEELPTHRRAQLSAALGLSEGRHHDEPLPHAFRSR
jgi:DNA-binding SARP family transcriptional activator